MTMKINLCSLLGYLLLLLCLFDHSSGECDSDCNGHGYCTELFEINGCVCNEFWKGEECTERWRDDINWHNTFLIYRALGIAFFAFLTLVSFYEMIQFIRITKREVNSTLDQTKPLRAEGCSPWSLVSYLGVC